MQENLAKFQPDRLTINEFDHWLVTVRVKQVTLGDAVLLLKRDEPSLAGLRDKEAKELPRVVKWYENAAAELFKAERFNYIAAMMKDLFVHFHALPRYSGERTFAGRAWKDTAWPKAATLDDVTTADAELDALVKAFRGLKA